MKPRRIRRTKQVADDIIEIYRFIHARSPESAERVFNAIESSIKALLHIPGAGRLWNSSDPRLEGMRVTPLTPYRNYLIFFRRIPNGIEVFRVIQGMQQMERIVEEIQ